MRLRVLKTSPFSKNVSAYPCYAPDVLRFISNLARGISQQPPRNAKGPCRSPLLLERSFPARALWMHGLCGSGALFTAQCVNASQYAKHSIAICVKHSTSIIGRNTSEIRYTSLNSRQKSSPPAYHVVFTQCASGLLIHLRVPMLQNSSRSLICKLLYFL